MVYKRMVEIGRVVFVAKGDGDGKLATIVDVVDGNRVSFIFIFDIFCSTTSIIHIVNTCPPCHLAITDPFLSLRSTYLSLLLTNVINSHDILKLNLKKVFLFKCSF